MLAVRKKKPALWLFQCWGLNRCLEDAREKRYRSVTERYLHCPKRQNGTLKQADYLTFLCELRDCCSQILERHLKHVHGLGESPEQFLGVYGTVQPVWVTRQSVAAISVPSILCPAPDDVPYFHVLYSLFQDTSCV